MPALRFDPCTLPPEAEALRQEVRAFLSETLADYPAVKRAESWSGGDKAFSRKVGAKGWIGMTWPKRYGGGGRSAFERYVVLEEMLAAGAPVGTHWIADRQSGPLILRYGTEEQRRDILPRICRGELCFCIGMSEPDSGSDLASIRTRGTRNDRGWVINGTKIWTSKAHESDYMIALVRTDPKAESKHAGLSQFLIDMKTPGITARPIENLAGEMQFNEVFFEDVQLPPEALLGNEGDGWQQVTNELAYERSGPERYLSSYQVVVELLREVSQSPSERQAIGIGRIVARMASLRQMSISVAAMLEAGESPALEASIVKELGVTFEQELPHFAHDLIGREPMLDHGGDLDQVQAYVTQVAPSFSLRGGTREVMRGIIARGLALR